MAMALMAMISMAVSFSTPFALSLFNPAPNADLTGAVSERVTLASPLARPSPNGLGMIAPASPLGSASR